MKLKKSIKFVAVVLIFAMATLAFPLCTLASDATQNVSVPESVTDIVPPASEISEDTDFTQGFSPNRPSFGRMTMMASSNTISGGCSFTKVSSTTVTTSGYSVCTAWDPGISVGTSLQAYYSGAWHNMHTKVNTTGGTYVSNSQGYTVTSGYYYRTVGTHWLSDGTTTTSRTNGMLVS